jgi:hypothetical protein
MNASKRAPGEKLRIIWAVALKDIVDAVKNKTTLSIIIGVAFLMLSGQALPLLLRLEKTPAAVVYDAGRSRLLAELKKDRDLRLRAVDSQAGMEETVAESAEVLLGLAIPPDFDQMAGAESAVELEGYVVHWADPAEVQEVKAFFEGRLAGATGQPVQIVIRDQGVYPSPQAGGRPFMAAMSLVVAVVTICGAIVPFLMIEEKETHTLDALLVSPADIGQVVAGKALAGVFYGLTAAGVVVAFNVKLVTHWPMAVVAAACGAAFAVSIGLLLGSLFDNPQSMNLWFGGVILVLLMPLLLTQAMGSNVPALLKTIMPGIPSVRLINVTRVAFSGSVPWGEVLVDLGVVLGSTAILLATVIWRMRRSDR